jgi:hypothetical protein
MAFSRSAVSAAVAIVIAAPVLAQNTTSAVGGRVVAADGKPVAGANVAILHVDSGSLTNATTDAEGRYLARGLRVGGPYTITVTKDGNTDKRDGVFLNLAETLNYDATLGAPVTTITITGTGLGSKFNAATMGSGTNIGSREIAAQASIQRNLQDYARIDPRVSQTDKERGEISAAGQNTRYNNITIDGVSISDTFGLESNNLPTKKQPISIDAIQSVQVNVSNYDVTQKGYTGANVNAVTKSGTNEFKGSVYYVYRDEALTGQRFNRTNGRYSDTPKFDEKTIGFTLGGPILQDKLFFFGSYEEFKSSKTSPAFGPVGSAQTNVGILPESITEAQVIGRGYGIDIGTDSIPAGVSLDVKDTLLKLDWNISDNHRASVRYNKTEQTEPFFPNFSSTALSLNSHWYNQVKENESIVAQWFADWTDNFSTELKLSQRNYRSEPLSLNGTRMPQVVLRFTDTLAAATPGTRDLSFGTERSRHFNVLETETTDLYAGANWNLGDHELKFGLDYADNSVFNAFLQDTMGQYRFQCEGGTYTFGTFANCDAMTVEQRNLAVLENFRNGNPSFFQQQIPNAGLTLADATATWSYENTGVFLQDTWRVSKGLNLMLGARLDKQAVPSRPIANPDAAAAFGYDNTNTLDGNTLLQPRLGFNWNLSSPETRRQLRGGVGLFQGAAANVWLSNPFSNTGKATAFASCTSFENCNTAGADFSGDPNNQPTLTAGSAAANVDLLSPGLEQPSVWKLNLAFDTQLPELPVLGRLVASAEWLYTKNKTGVFYQHLNLGAPTRFGSDGREMYYSAAGLDPACYNSNGSAITSGACVSPSGFRDRAQRNAAFNNVYLTRETDKGSGNVITLSLSQPGLNGLGWGVAYTRTASTDVNPLTSSTSGSNWLNRTVFNPNEEVASNSNYLVRDRVSANMTWSRAFVGNYRTSVGLFYEGRKGKPYSWTYINDLNGDGVSGNDLMYIPRGPGSGEVAFRTPDDEARFWQVVESIPELSSSKGSVVGRNTSFAPWVNSFDLRVSQEFAGFAKGHKSSLTFDLLNVGNLLNKRWGRINEVGFPSNRSFVNYVGVDSAGRYVYSTGATEDYVTRQESGESQWAAQITLKYEF